MNNIFLLFYFGVLPIICTTNNISHNIPKEKLFDNITAYNIIGFSENHVHRIEYRRPIFPPSFLGLKNDSIFQVRIYTYSDSTLKNDSLVIENTFVHAGKGNSWVCHYDNGNTRIGKFNKCRHPSEVFLKANDNLYWEAEMEMQSNKLYNKDGRLIRKEIRFGKMAFVTEYGNWSRYENIFHNK